MKVIGSFVFRNEGDGCLTCKWLNEGLKKPLIECSSLIRGTSESDGFVGDYLTSYIDFDNQHYLRYLRITLDVEKSGIYELKWYHNQDFSDIAFIGWGMLYEGKLIGHYRTENPE